MYSLYDTWGFPCVFPHSEISGSLAMCAYPKLIAAYHVLHRLLMPRHSPCALCSLTYLVKFFKVLHLISQRIFFGLLLNIFEVIFYNSYAIFKEQIGGSKWTRTIDLTLIRRAL